MILALCLLALAAALMVFGPGWLERGRRPARSPLAELIAWQLAGWMAVGFVVLASTLLAVPALATAGRLPASVESCLAALRNVPNPADSAAVQIIAGATLVLALARLGGCAVRSAATNHRNRARHRTLLCLVATPDDDLGVHVLANSAALAYCLPGRGGRVVFTSGALAKLDATQRTVVLAHERAHLRGHHHLLIASANTLTRAFPGVPLFRRMCARTVELVEMRADDVASRRWGPRPVAAALLALADMNQSATVLAASGVTTAERVERLLHNLHAPAARPLHATRAAGVAIMASLTAASPVLLATAGHAVLCLL